MQRKTHRKPIKQWTKNSAKRKMAKLSHAKESFFKKNDNKKMSDDFVAIAIESKIHSSEEITSMDLESAAWSSHLYHKPPDIVFEHLNLKDLPYADEPLLDPEKNLELKERNITRDASSRLVFRGHTNTIEMIDEAGGFHPSYALGVAPLGGDSPLDVCAHRMTSRGSGFISTSDDVCYAYEWGVIHARNAEKMKFTVYALKADGAMGPCKTYREYSVPGGIDKDKILGYRECELSSNGQYVKGGNVFIRKDIDAMLANQIAEGFLFLDEYIVPIQKQKGRIVECDDKPYSFKRLA